MNVLLSLLMITKNSGELLEKSLQSVKGFVDEIIVVDDYSKDGTIEIAQKYGAYIYQRKETDLGKQRAYGLEKCKGEWILMLDADETISLQLRSEIELKIKSSKCKVDGFYIPYQNHFLGKPIYQGGENYEILRLFRKDKAKISGNLIHEFVMVEGEKGKLKGKIFHYSYRTLGQTFTKFTDYAKREAIRKLNRGERTGIDKIILYPIHMFWARYIKDKGYKDFSLRIFLDIGFAYMEFMTYVFMFFYKNKSQKA